jgi:hypothetical protein
LFLGKGRTATYCLTTLHCSTKNQSQDDPYLPSSTACNRLWSGGNCAEFRRTFSAIPIYHVGGRNFDKDVGGVESGVNLEMQWADSEAMGE